MTNSFARLRVAVALTILFGMVAALHAQQLPVNNDTWKTRCSVLASAAPGDAVAFFPFYSRVMLEYYRGRYGASAPSLHVFAPGYYDGGEDVRDLLKALDSDPHGFRHVWVLIAGDEREFYGGAVEEKLQSIYGAPAVQKFADVDVLEYGR